MKSSIRMILAMAVLIAITGCSSSITESKLVGKWVGKTGSVEFFKDKTGLINAPIEQLDLPVNVQFRWEIVEKDSVRMNIAVNGGKTTVAKFDGKALIVEDDRFEK